MVAEVVSKKSGFMVMQMQRLMEIQMIETVMFVSSTTKTS